MDRCGQHAKTRSDVTGRASPLTTIRLRASRRGVASEVGTGEVHLPMMWPGVPVPAGLDRLNGDTRGWGYSGRRWASK